MASTAPRWSRRPGSPSYVSQPPLYYGRRRFDAADPLPGLRGRVLRPRGDAGPWPVFAGPFVAAAAAPARCLRHGHGVTL